ncbi:axonemal dynein light chain domain-containing protein 1-like isoform X2 [Acanthaster planci]|uniref:Axonemal dynein light chain domain-containing protein 1-like isoform X2 n=1 Tax=Acanthaster planci TaxID=133434 RepID=A0A8B7XTP9_ACAPL|nr:axonemal dynein light chain domain-containing protein 1-like isoform X2 [Acanthaster planci]
MTTAVTPMPEMANVGGRDPSPPLEPKGDSRDSPTPRKTKVLVAKTEGQSIATLPDLRSSDKDIDKTKPLPTSLQSEFIPEDILNALTNIPTPGVKEKMKQKGVQKAKAKVPKGGAPAANMWNFPNRRRRFQHLTDQPISMTGAGRDISFLYDVAFTDKAPDRVDPTQDPSSVRALSKQADQDKGMSVPDSLIPSEYHVVKAKGVQHLEFQEDKYTTNLMDTEKNQVAFPSLKPSSRYEVLQLKETMDSMIDKAGIDDEEVEIKGPTQMHNLLELIKKEQNIYNLIFHELIRQVSVECAERGELLANLRQRYSKLLDKVPRQVKSLHQEVMAQRALDRRLTEELFRFKTSISQLTNELSDVREHDKVVTSQAQQAQQELAAALAESEKNAGLLAEYHELYELQRARLESQVIALSREKELWSGAAYNLALKVTEANSLATARRLHISERLWSKLANHFTIVLSDRDTEELSQLQVCIATHRQLTLAFAEELKAGDERSHGRLQAIGKGIEKWIQEFDQFVVLQKEGSVTSGATSVRESRASHDNIQTVVQAPPVEMIQKLYDDIRSWEEQLNKEVEKYGGDILLGFEESMYSIKKQVEMWTEVALHIFNRHRPEDGSDYPEHKRLLKMNKDVKQECDMLHQQFQIRVNGENGSAKGFIQIANALESWDTKLNSILNGGAMPLESEWMRLYELFSDWLVTIDETAGCIGSTQKEDAKAEGKPHDPLSMEDVFRSTQKWLASTTNGIDSEDSKLVEQVQVLHAEMVHWIIQVLLRLAPNQPNSPPEAVESSMATTDTIAQIQEKAAVIFDKLTRFTNYITGCCSNIVAEEVQRRQDEGAEDADHELRDLKKLKSECADWIHTATILIEDLKCLDPNYVPVASATPATGDEKLETAVTPAPTPGVIDGAELIQSEGTPSQTPAPTILSDTQKDAATSPKVTPVSTDKEEVAEPATPAGKEGSTAGKEEVNMSEMQAIGDDDNVRTLSLEEPIQQPEKIQPRISALQAEAGPRTPTPDPQKAYEALMAVKTLQGELLMTEERAQKAEDRVAELEQELKETQEKLRALERKSATPKLPEKEADASSVISREGRAADMPNQPGTASSPTPPTPTTPHAAMAQDTPPSTPGRRPASQHQPSRPLSQASSRSGVGSRGSSRSKKSK